ncbi:uncharacterized protein MONBRDRAFT_6446 [Monosiga brevicollis MX1]|uniref:ATP-dependent helicase ATRX n=1 Tax=Monosiga brevicollis TaxID=81824 RepID=A9UTW4_MONBE|nr:uncharacterized protein MONBRDRAFT_6446 [Monosiga brevicollis MX1]EDQ91564.1 predicted protein [Monosiga brevicollis MX1]|eukprot:XP_001743986.1 hypothetical protein [Monosiga brevicollis MX1]
MSGGWRRGGSASTQQTFTVQIISSDEEEEEVAKALPAGPTARDQAPQVEKPSQPPPAIDSAPAAQPAASPIDADAVLVWLPCTICGSTIFASKDVKAHPVLECAVCPRCEFGYSQHMLDGQLNVPLDAQGSHERCTWCLQPYEGTTDKDIELLMCDVCPRVFCTECLQANLGPAALEGMYAADPWRCLCCEPSVLTSLRSERDRFIAAAIDNEDHIADNSLELKSNDAWTKEDFERYMSDPAIDFWVQQYARVLELLACDEPDELASPCMQIVPPVLDNDAPQPLSTKIYTQAALLEERLDHRVVLLMQRQIFGHAVSDEEDDDDLAFTSNPLDQPEQAHLRLKETRADRLAQRQADKALAKLRPVRKGRGGEIEGSGASGYVPACASVYEIDSLDQAAARDVIEDLEDDPAAKVLPEQQACMENENRILLEAGLQERIKLRTLQRDHELTQRHRGTNRISRHVPKRRRAPNDTLRTPTLSDSSESLDSDVAYSSAAEKSTDDSEQHYDNQDNGPDVVQNDLDDNDISPNDHSPGNSWQNKTTHAWGRTAHSSSMFEPSRTLSELNARRHSREGLHGEAFAFMSDISDLTLDEMLQGSASPPQKRHRRRRHPAQRNRNVPLSQSAMLKLVKARAANREENQRKDEDDLSLGFVVNLTRGHQEPILRLAPEVSQQLKSHQLQGIRFMWDNVVDSTKELMKDMPRSFSHHACILAHDMGLGKTMQWYKEGGMLVLGVAMLYSLLGTRQDKHVGHKLRKYLRKHTQLLVVDEAHLLGRKRYYDCINSFVTRCRILLTGTPLQNHLSEWVLSKLRVSCCCFRRVFGLHVTHFYRVARVVALPNPTTPVAAQPGDSAAGQAPDADWSTRRKCKYRLATLQSITAGFLQRRSRQDADAIHASRQEHVIFVKLSPAQLVLYFRCLVAHKQPRLQAPSSFWSLIRPLQTIITWPPSLVSSSSVAALETSKGPTRRLGRSNDNSAPAEAAAEAENSDVGDDDVEPFFDPAMAQAAAQSAKIDITLSLIREALSTNDKLVFFSQSLFVLSVIQQRLETELFALRDGLRPMRKDQDFFRLEGETSSARRKDMCDQFNQPDEPCRLFLVSIRAGATGLNMYGGNRVILFDVSWNPATDNQAISRCHRYGQQKTVYVYRLVAAGTIEEHILSRQINKMTIFQNVIDKSASKNNLSGGMMRRLLALPPAHFVAHLNNDAAVDMMKRDASNDWLRAAMDELLDKALARNMSESQEDSQAQQLENAATDDASSASDSDAEAHQQDAVLERVQRENKHWIARVMWLDDAIDLDTDELLDDNNTELAIAEYTREVSAENEIPAEGQQSVLNTPSDMRIRIPVQTAHLLRSLISRDDYQISTDKAGTSSSQAPQATLPTSTMVTEQPSQAAASNPTGGPVQAEGTEVGPALSEVMAMAQGQDTQQEPKRAKCEFVLIVMAGQSKVVQSTRCCSGEGVSLDDMIRIVDQDLSPDNQVASKKTAEAASTTLASNPPVCNAVTSAAGDNQPLLLPVTPAAVGTTDTTLKSVELGTDPKSEASGR